MRPVRTLLVLAALLAACSDDAAPRDAASDEGTPTVRPELAGTEDSVLLLGDSLTVGADQFGDVERLLRRAGFDEVDVIAEESRDTGWAIDQIEDVDEVPPLVVVELGTNPGADADGFDELVATLVDDLRAKGAQKIAWLTPVHGRDDRYTDKVEVLEAADGIDLIADWATVVHDDPTRLAADGLHPTQEGYGELADFLVDTAAGSPGEVVVTQLDLVAIVVDDYDTAIGFFVDALGFELVEDSPSTTNDGRPKRWVVVRPPGAQTGVLLAQADGDEQSAVVGRQLAGRVGFFLRVDDFDGAVARMEAAGVVFTSPPRDEPYGRVAVFVDVAGNKWDLLGPR